MTFDKSVDDNGEERSLKDVIDGFSAYCIPVINVPMETYQFSCMKQKGIQNFDQHLTDLKKQAAKCQFSCSSCNKSYAERMIRDHLVLNCPYKDLQKIFLKKPELSLKEIGNAYRSYELSERFMKDLHVSRDEVFVMNRAPPITDAARVRSAQQTSNRKQCRYCSYMHVEEPGKCPAHGKVCNICQGLNHFARCCDKRKSKSTYNEKRAISSGNWGSRGKRDTANDQGPDMKRYSKEGALSVEAKMCAGTSHDTLEQVFLDSLSTVSIDHMQNNIGSKKWMYPISIEDTEIEFKVDTGSDVNILPLKIFEKIAPSGIQLRNSNKVLVAYGGFEIIPKGSVQLLCKPRGRAPCQISFVVADVESTPILSLQTCVNLKLISQIESIIEEPFKQNFVLRHKAVFEGIGKLPNKYSIKLCENAVPVVRPVRRVPECLKNRLRAVLNDLEHQGVVAKVAEPTDWVNDLVIVEKPDSSLRLCLNPMDLNKFVRREHFEIPSVEGLTCKLAGSTVYSVLDLKQGFYHMELDEASSFLCTFNTPFGRYRFLRAPFGLASNPEIFQREMIKIFGDIHGLEIFFDDLIVHAKTEREHDLILEKVMDRAVKHGVRFNSGKLQYKVNSVKYLGMIFSAEGARCDPDRVKVIKDMPEPRTKKQLQRFMGVVNYLNSFLPNLAEQSAPLRILLKNGVKWNWGEEQQLSFERIKKLVCNTPILQLFDPNLDITLQCDASKGSLGVCLLQNGKPVFFSSRSLTPTEQRYSMVEKELLGICYGAQRYHQFIYGHPVTVHTDHRPLVSILRKDIHKNTARIQRMQLKLLKYQLDVQYRPGKQMYIADFLSRIPNSENTSDDPSFLEVVHSVSLCDYLPVSEKFLLELKEETQNDEILNGVIRMVDGGWQEVHHGDLGAEIKYYYKLRDELFVKEGVLFFNDRIVIPKALQRATLQKIHDRSHCGVNKTKNLAKTVVFWRNMGREIEKYVLGCYVCNSHCSRNVKEPLLPSELPLYPFQKVGIDICQDNKDLYLVLEDYYSRWLEIIPIASKSVACIVRSLKPVFATHGVPQFVRSDNSPFNSFEFREFGRDWGFTLVTSSPGYPKSNGMAEKGVDIAKRILRRNKDWQKALLHYRSTPLQFLGGLAPSQILMSRKLRSEIPMISSSLMPKLVDRDRFQEMDDLNKRKTKAHYDRSATREREPFSIGERVWYWNQGEWRTGTIDGRLSEPRSYLIRDDESRAVYRRTSVHIRVFKES